MLQKQKRIVVVTRETRMKGLLQRWATRGQARFVMRKARAQSVLHSGDLEEAAAVDVDDLDVLQDYEEEDTRYEESLEDLVRGLDFGLPVQVIDRQYLPSVDFEMCAVVVVIGQDGLVANTAKYVGRTPLIGVNPEPDRYDGVLLPFTTRNVRQAISRVLKNQAGFQNVTMAEAILHDGQRLLAFNDFFIGARTHVSARYELRCGDRLEEQSSSGILVSTGAGSTGWISSVMNMTRGVAESVSCSISREASFKMSWDHPGLAWVVREPFQSMTTGTQLVCGRLGRGDELVVLSRMATEGVIFSDGVESDCLEFHGGSIVRIGVAADSARLVLP